MDWEELLSEIEDHAHDAHIVARELETAELVSGQWSSTTWLDIATGQPAIFRLSTGSLVQGEVRQSAQDFIAVEHQGMEVIIARRHVMDVTVPQLRITPATVSRWLWSHAFRLFERQNCTVVISRADHTTVGGRVRAVGKDFVALAKNDQTVVVVPYASVVSVICPR